MTEPCFGTEYYPAGMFCEACPDKVECEEATRARHNIPDSPNTAVGKPMFEAHVQETPAIIFPNGGAEFTPKVAASLVKKKANGVVIHRDEHKRGPYGKLGIPYEAGTAAYARAYYWCKKLDKTFPEIKTDFEAGKLANTGKKANIQDETKKEPTGIVEEHKKEPETPAQDHNMKTRAVEENRIEDLILLLREISTFSSTISSNVAALNGNILSIRKEIQDLRADVKRYSGGRGQK